MIQFLAKNLSYPLVPLFCLVGATLLIGAGLPLGGSLWLDEALSAWVSAGTLEETLSRSATYQGQPPFYFTLLWVLQSMFGFSELLLRIPSLLAGVACLALLYLVAREYCSPESAAVAPLFLVANDEFHKFSMSARPYTLALCMVLIAVYSLLKSQQRNSNRLLLVAGLAITSAIYFHPVFVVSTPLLALLLYLERAPGRSYLKDLSSAGLLVLVGMLPLLPQITALANRNEELFFAGVPDSTAVLKAIFPPFPVVAFITAFVCTAIFFKSFSFNASQIKPSKLLVLTGWAVFGPCLYAIHAHCTGHSLFLPRIMFWRLPALALVAALIIGAVQPKLVRHFMIIVFSFLTVSVYTLRPWHMEEWKQVVHDTTSDPQKRVAVFSGLIELDQLDWVVNPDHHDYLTAPYSVYAPDIDTTIVLPRDPVVPAAQAYIKQQVVPQVRDGDFLVMMKTFRKNGSRYAVHSKLIETFQSSGILVQPVSEEGIIHVYTLHPTSDSAH